MVNVKEHKPIFTVGLPVNVSFEEMSNIRKQISEQFDDYHVLIYPNHTEETVFNVFHQKDVTDIEIEELRELVLNKINEL